MGGLTDAALMLYLESTRATRIAIVDDDGGKARRVLFALIKAVAMLAMGTALLRGAEMVLRDQNTGAWVQSVFGYLYIILFGAVIGYVMQSLPKRERPGRSD